MFRNVLVALTVLVCVEPLYSVVAQTEDTTCTSTLVKKGERGEIDFFIEYQILYTAEAFYITRNNDTAHIVHCERQTPESKIECGQSEGLYQADKIGGNQLTLFITNATVGLEGVYTLYAVVNGTEKSLASCNLTIADAVTTCESVPIVEGMTGQIVFTLKHDLNAAPHTFTLDIKREEDQEVFQCERLKPESKIQCQNSSRHFRSEGIVGNKIILYVPNATTDQEGTYTLHVVVNGFYDHPVSCNFTVFEKLTHANSSSLAKTIVPILIAFLVLFFVVILICGIIHTCRKRCRLQKGKEQKVEFQQLHHPEKDDEIWQT